MLTVAPSRTLGQYEEEEKKKRIAASPGGLDPQEVMDTLPAVMREAFEVCSVENGSSLCVVAAGLSVLAVGGASDPLMRMSDKQSPSSVLWDGFLIVHPRNPGAFASELIISFSALRVQQAQDIQMLQEAIKSMDLEQAKYHIDR